jgi:phage tail sheath protein FI
MGTMKTPGVYIVEKNAFPNSVVEVATAVPAFIGYTEIAENRGKTLLNKPWRITSMSEFRKYYGMGPESKYTIAVNKDKNVESEFTQDKDGYVLAPPKIDYLLYRSMMLFYQNGGGPCYVVSVGFYKDDEDIASDKLKAGVITLLKEQEPTMVVIPETVRLKPQDSDNVQSAMLMHCGETMRNRIAILDIIRGDKDRADDDPIASFRNGVGINNLDFAAAYYPWLNTSIVIDKELSFENIANPDLLQTLLTGELNDGPEKAGIKKDGMLAEINKLGVKDKLASTVKSAKDDKPSAAVKVDPESVDNLRAVIEAEKKLLDKSLRAISPELYGNILEAIIKRLNLLPPAAAMAGVYTSVDNSRGVWKAPANVSLNAVVSPAVNISHEEQEDLNVTPQGKSINAIRSFIGEGTLVWGARTLDGNSLDWRYVSVRRTMIMLEESIRLAAKAYVFEPNNANTWVTVKSMIRNFLTGIWKRGGLAGAVPDDAFSVHVGLGDTMTSVDILEGILRITVLVAVTRPAEFIEITFQQQQQKS